MYNYSLNHAKTLANGRVLVKEPAKNRRHVIEVTCLKDMRESVYLGERIVPKAFMTKESLELSYLGYTNDGCLIMTDGTLVYVYELSSEFTSYRIKEASDSFKELLSLSSISFDLVLTQRDDNLILDMNWTPIPDTLLDSYEISFRPLQHVVINGELADSSEKVLGRLKCFSILGETLLLKTYGHDVRALEISKIGTPTIFQFKTKTIIKL